MGKRRKEGGRDDVWATGERERESQRKRKVQGESKKSGRMEQRRKSGPEWPLIAILPSVPVVAFLLIESRGSPHWQLPALAARRIGCPSVDDATSVEAHAMSTQLSLQLWQW